MPSEPLYGISELQRSGIGAITDGAEVIGASELAMPGGDLMAPIVLPRVPAKARPVSPGTIEKSASMLRSIAFAASRPSAGETPAERGRAFASVGSSLRQQIHGDQMARLRSAAPELGPRVTSALLAACGALLGSQDADAGFEWASAELDELAKHLPPATSPVFPGAYYYEIFSSDIVELSRALSERRQTEARRRAVAADVLTVLARPGVGAAEVHGGGRAAADVGLLAEAAAARACGELIEREERSRLAYESAAAEGREARRAQKEAEAATAREARQLADEKHRRQQAVDELSGLKAALAREEELRRKVEQAQVRTMEELRAQEEARWEAERKAQAEAVRNAELEALQRRTEEELSSRVEAAEARETKASADAGRANKQHIESERMRVALDGRVAALEGVKAQLEQQLALEREACGVELGLRQKAEAAYAEAQTSAAEAQQAAAEATQAAEVAKGALEAATAELSATEERLRVANDGSLDQQMAAASSEEAVKQLKALRGDDASKMQRLNTERATLTQQVEDLHAQLASTKASAERADVEANKQRYELHAQLTEVHRRCEDLQAQATRAELLLQHERETGLTASDHEKRLTSQLDSERRAKQALQQQLAAEAALRQKSDASENAVSKELQARGREAELGAQRLQAMQAELHRSREDARLAREALADAKALANKFERERDADREEARRERAKRQERDVRAPPQQPSAALQRRPAHTPPSLQQHLQQPSRAGIEPPPPAQQPPSQSVVSDELSRSDLWNFSQGALAGAATRERPMRAGGAGGSGAADAGTLPRIRSPFNTAAGQAAGLHATSLAPEDARALYGSVGVPGID